MAFPRFSSFRALGVVAVCAAVFVFVAQIGAAPASAIEPPVPAVNPKLARHQATFDEARVMQVSERVFVAFAHSMCNVVMIVGDDSVAIFDTGFRLEEGRAARDALMEHTSLPISAVVYSHGHADHTGGSRAFVPEGETSIDVYAHRNYARYLGEMHGATRPVFRRRAVAQLGMILPAGPEGTVGSGGGRVVEFDGTLGYAEPTRVVDDRLTIELGGVSVELFHAPGDLDDAIAAWIPSEGVLLAGDTVVGTHTYPILSTPRHEKGRDARAYVETLSRMRDLPVKTLVGGHGLPIEGEAEVATLLERTEMVGQFMIDETLRMIRQGFSGEEVAATLRVPASVSGGEEFADHYHRLSWIVRGIHAKEMGWYSGDVLDLVAHPPAARAERLIDALGGEAKTLELARQAYSDGDARWAAELATLALQASPDDPAATEIKAHALTAIAYQSDSANERNYLLTEARIMTGDIGWNVIARATFDRVKRALFGATVAETALAAPSQTFVDNLGPRLDAERSSGADLLVEIRVADRNESHFVRVREGVMIRERSRGATPSAIVSLDHRTLVLASEGTSTWAELASDDLVTVDQGRDEFERFTSYFDWSN